MRTEVVNLSSDETSPRDPTARCDRCGAQGTVARATTDGPPALTRRFCTACWPAARAELEAAMATATDEWRRAWHRDPQQAPPPPVGWAMASRHWSDVEQFLALIARPPRGGSAPTSEQLRGVASAILAMAPEVDGSMPPAVATFVRQHCTPAP